jgi:hypothetical protein
MIVAAGAPEEQILWRDCKPSMPQDDEQDLYSCAPVPNLAARPDGYKQQ